MSPRTSIVTAAPPDFQAPELPIRPRIAMKAPAHLGNTFTHGASAIEDNSEQSIMPQQPIIATRFTAHDVLNNKIRRCSPSAIQNQNAIQNQRTPFPHVPPTDRHLPDCSNPTPEKFTRMYVDFIIYCNPAVPLTHRTTPLEEAFNSVPKSDDKSFPIWDVFELHKRLQSGEIKNWASLAAELGVRRPTKQNKQKLTQYGHKLKKWLKQMHIDAFFAYLEGKESEYFTLIPGVQADGEFIDERDGVAKKDDLALIALYRDIKSTKRGRKPRPDKEEDMSVAARAIKRARTMDYTDSEADSPMTGTPSMDPAAAQLSGNVAAPSCNVGDALTGQSPSTFGMPPPAVTTGFHPANLRIPVEGRHALDQDALFQARLAQTGQATMNASKSVLLQLLSRLSLSSPGAARIMAELSLVTRDGDDGKVGLLAGLAAALVERGNIVDVKLDKNGSRGVDALFTVQMGDVKALYRVGVEGGTGNLMVTQADILASERGEEDGPEASVSAGEELSKAKQRIEELEKMLRQKEDDLEQLKMRVLRAVM
ncbi:hypothetical protein SAICODRAFT_26696 [Saitoella complicata NRRL Y-17804]|nr:uncharacterized protein SAICODRAFT_26696 [Saitoella complicata NRRL Y-17804]ODQ51612.1 hypothetical protein SAICODRAFT_26696 [Saitoella complicata NRRL Y-17804]